MREQRLRRSGRTWFMSSTNIARDGAILQPVVGNRPLRSCLKVRTMTDSLASCKKNRQGRSSIWSTRFSMKNGSSSVLFGSFTGRSVPARRSKAKQPRRESEKSTNDDNRTASASTMRQRVSFDMVEMREYPQILGDNPSVASGPAIMLGWEYTVPPDFPAQVDDYEDLRCAERKAYEQDDVTQNRLTEEERVAFLRSRGFTHTEIRKAVVATNRARTKRLRTFQNIDTPIERNEEKMEDAWLVLKTLFRCRCICRGRNDDLDELWTEAQRKRV